MKIRHKSCPFPQFSVIFFAVLPKALRPPTLTTMGREMKRIGLWVIYDLS